MFYMRKCGLPEAYDCGHLKNSFLVFSKALRQIPRTKFFFLILGNQTLSTLLTYQRRITFLNYFSQLGYL